MGPPGRQRACVAPPAALARARACAVAHACSPRWQVLERRRIVKESEAGVTRKPRECCCHLHQPALGAAAVAAATGACDHHHHRLLPQAVATGCCHCLSCPAAVRRPGSTSHVAARGRCCWVVVFWGILFFWGPIEMYYWWACLQGSSGCRGPCAARRVRCTDSACVKNAQKGLGWGRTLTRLSTLLLRRWCRCRRYRRPLCLVAAEVQRRVLQAVQEAAAGDGVSHGGVSS
eukprot:COSAG01_NODE_1294_length_10874_cov_23.128062_5_plen_232_part_00